MVTKMALWRLMTHVRRNVSLVAFLQLLVVNYSGINTAIAFSVQLDKNTGTLEEPSSILNENYDYKMRQIRKRQSTKPATCTCTCETKVSDSRATNDIDDYPSMTHFEEDNRNDELSDDPADHPSMTAKPVVIGKQANTVEHNPAKMTVNKLAELNSLDSAHKGSWGHRSRYPWKDLADRMCYRDPCQSDQECCLRFNICDRSARVCVDCWYGSSCSSERDCCFKYPNCQFDKQDTGKCVNNKT